MAPEFSGLARPVERGVGQIAWMVIKLSAMAVSLKVRIVDNVGVWA